MTTGFQRGLEAAAAYLVGTAQDFEQTSARIQKMRHPSFAETHQQCDCKDKARLLRGQANHILNIKESK